MTELEVARDERLEIQWWDAASALYFCWRRSSRRVLVSMAARGGEIDVIRLRPHPALEQVHEAIQTYLRERAKEAPVTSEPRPAEPVLSYVEPLHRWSIRWDGALLGYCFGRAPVFVPDWLRQPLSPPTVWDPAPRLVFAGWWQPR